MLFTSLLSIFLFAPLLQTPTKLGTLHIYCLTTLTMPLVTLYSKAGLLRQDKYPTRRLTVPPWALPQQGTNKDHGTQFLVCV